MWKCNDCIHKGQLDIKRGICLGGCKDVYKRLNRENHYYQRAVSKPLNCGKCSYLKEGMYCSVSNWSDDDLEGRFNYVRKNYLTKNTPKWCKLE